MLNIPEENFNDPAVDSRDSKIIHLAKKCRMLTVALNKERGESHSRNDEVRQLQAQCEHLQRELELVSSPAARAAAREGTDRSPRRTDENHDFRKDIQQMTKQLEEWRKKCQSAVEENKKLQRALAKEIGDGVSIDQAVDDGWRGRAQQIVMLKNKIKRLEAGSPASGTALSAARAKGDKGVVGTDVDSKAMDDLAVMSSDRQNAIEALTDDHIRVTEESQLLKQKVEAQKARIKILEGESTKQKAHLKVLLDRVSTDDELLDALREELARLRLTKTNLNHPPPTVDRDRDRDQRPSSDIPIGSRVVKLGTSSMSSGASVGVGGGVGVGVGGASSECVDCRTRAAEVLRLSRMCSQQAAQLDTQDTVIKQLRTQKTR